MRKRPSITSLIKKLSPRRKDESLFVTYNTCSLGGLLVAQNFKGICAIFFGDDRPTLLNNLHQQYPNAIFETASEQQQQVVADVIALIENPFDTQQLPLDIDGTEFQKEVWRALQQIPAGETLTYSDIGKKIGKPSAVRAVANACAANKLAVIIPCHRVIRTDGSLSGYRWGIDLKAKLLRKEKLVLKNHRVVMVTQ